MRGPFGRDRDGRLRLRLPAEGVGLLEAILVDLRGRVEDSEDPDHRRLYPPAYTDEAEEARFRDLTRGYLVAAKQGAIDVVLDVLARGAVRRGMFEAALADAEAEALLGALNDARLVLGTALEVTDDEQPVGFLPPDDPKAPRVNAYIWLGAAQEALLELLLRELGPAGSD